MKKLLCLAVLCFGFVGCGSGSTTKTTPSVAAPTESTTPAMEPAKENSAAPTDPAPTDPAPTDPAAPAGEATEPK